MSLAAVDNDVIAETYGVDSETGEVVTITGVHPVADLFPMLDPEDAAELAESVKTRGLEHPIILDGEGRVLDGRNRLAACTSAGVKPVVAIYAGDDPDGYAAAVNLSRRHLSKGQRAMIAATVYRNDTTRDTAERASVSSGQVGHARIVSEFTPELVASVIAGATSLDDAYRTAQSAKAQTVMKETHASETTRRLTKLQKVAPDIASMVTEEHISLTEGEKLHEDREEEKRERADVWESNAYLATSHLAPYEHDEPLNTFIQLAPRMTKHPDLPDRLRQAARNATRLADRLERK